MNHSSPGTSVSDKPTISGSSGRKTARLIVGTILTLVVCFFVARTLVSQWSAVVAFRWDLRWGWLALSAFLMWLDFVLLFQLWRVLLKAVSGVHITFATSYRISTLANLGKYLPGKVWSVAGLVYMLRDEGIPIRQSVAATALHQAFTLIPGALFVSVILGTGIWGGFPAIWIIAGLAISVLCLYPPVFSFLLNFGLRLVKREPITVQLPFPRALALFGAYVFVWILYGGSFWAMTLGLGVPPGPFWTVSAAYSAAYLIGFLALFAPGGLGVREGILAIVLAPYVPAGLATAIAVISRFWATIVELAGLLPVAFGFGRRKPH